VSPESVEEQLISSPASARELYAAELATADELYAAGDFRVAGQAVTRGLRIASHCVLHFESLRSPLADDPASFTAPLRSSKIAAAMRAPRGRSSGGGSSGDGVGGGRSSGGVVGGGPSSIPSRPTRLLIMTRVNADFLGEIREHFEHHAGYETRFVDFA
jgi:uncharacterized membrane protein YgcG